jgi:DNA repair protein RadC
MKKSFGKYELILVKEGKIPYEFDKDITSPSILYDTVKSLQLENKAEEEMHLICLDTKNHPIAEFLISRGSLNSSIVHPREVFKRAVLANACSIILIHNHPSGNPRPSSNDIEITRRLSKCGEILDVKILDHIIVGEGTYYSMKEECDM